MDRNSVIGFTLLVALVVTYFLYNKHEQDKYYELRRADSITTAKSHPRVADSSKAANQLAAAAPIDNMNDSLRKTLPAAYSGKEQSVTLENKKLALTFTSKGAYPVSAELKGYKTYWQKPQYLFNGKGNMLNAILPVNNNAVATSDLYFTPVTHDEPNGDKTIDFSADMGNGKKVDIIYTLPADDYMMTCNMTLTGMPASSLVMNWNTEGLHSEKDIMNERMATQLYYKYKNGNNDYFTIKSDSRKDLDEGAIQWTGFRKQYFSSVLISKEGFTKATIHSNAPATDTNVVAENREVLDVPMKPGNIQNINLQWYIGPNDYNTLRAYHLDLDQMIPLGYGPMAFVKYINKWTLVPIFYFLSSFISNYALIIVLMTLMIRLVLSFFTYKSYLSAAKMRVLKPELDVIRAQCGDDTQKFSVEQMKLFKSAGVNPLGGCLPSLIQIPIIVSLYYLFPSLIEFRQKSFLWAPDLSTYDSIFHLPFSIPSYGDHVSLFTLLMTASSLFLALYNRNMTTQDPNNPMMKYLPFIFPIFLMGIFNKMAAALTFYYTFSNILSISQQFIIQKYFINEKAIHAELQANKSKPATPSKWAARMEQLQKSQADRGKQTPIIKNPNKK